MTRDQDLLQTLQTQQTLVVQLAAVLARELGYTTGLRTDWYHLSWPFVVIGFPHLGEVAWPIPQTDLRLHLPPYPHIWDGSRDLDHYHRLTSFITAKDFAAHNSPPKKRAKRPSAQQKKEC